MTAAINETAGQRAGRLLRQAEAQRRYLAKRKAEGKPITQNQYRYEKHRKQNLRKYGLTPESADALMLQQGGGCAICAQAIEWQGPASNLSDSTACIDHCHTGGHVRGLLCRKCNSGLGMFRDRPDFLRAAATYLENNNGS